MKIKAYAKINMALDVIRRREDGYHDLDMIMVPIDLYDELEITFNDKNIIECNNLNLELDESNTIYKAIKLMKDTYHISNNFKVKLKKNIPMQAGLAGGSADAAATLKAIIELCNLDIDLDTLILLGKKIGADVPFCIVNKPSRVKGIGEKIRTISLKDNIDILLVKPESGVSTKLAFEGINFDTCSHPDLDKIEADINKTYELLDNTLEEVAIRINPDIKEIKEKLNTYSFDKVLMSGSGSSVFAIGNIEEINKAYEELKDKYKFVYKTKILK